MRWVIFVIVVAGFAGCTSDGSTDVVAEELRSTADRRAARELTDPVLVVVLGFETTDRDARELAGGGDGIEGFDAFMNRLLWRADANPGDGLAPAWAFGYQGADGSSIIAVDAERRVAVVAPPGISTDATPRLPPLEWRISSADAAEILRSDDTFARAANDTVVWTLEYDSEVGDLSPTWSAFARANGRQVIRQVDAMTGEVEAGPELSGPGTTINPQGGSGQGSVSAVETRDEATFQVTQAGHPVLSISTSNFATTAGDAILILVDPAGAEHPFEEVGTFPLSYENQYVNVQDPLPGTYKLRAEHSGGASYDFRFDWCAQGWDGRNLVEC